MGDSKVDEKKQTPAERAVSARPFFDGPHRAVRKKQAAEDGSSAPAYVVTVTKKDPENAEAAAAEGKPKVPPAVMHKYDPEELRLRARSLLGNKAIDPEHRRVLAEILEGTEKKAGTKEDSGAS